MDEHKQPVPVADLHEWAAWFETAARTVARTQIGDILVSTVFLGIDHNFSRLGPPVLFETMVFDQSGKDIYCERHHSFEEAEWAHEQAVKRMKSTTST